MCCGDVDGIRLLFGHWFIDVARLYASFGPQLKQVKIRGSLEKLSSRLVEGHGSRSLKKHLEDLVCRHHMVTFWSGSSFAGRPCTPGTARPESPRCGGQDKKHNWGNPFMIRNDSGMTYKGWSEIDNQSISQTKVTEADAAANEAPKQLMATWHMWSWEPRKFAPRMVPIAAIACGFSMCLCVFMGCLNALYDSWIQKWLAYVWVHEASMEPKLMEKSGLNSPGHVRGIKILGALESHAGRRSLSQGAAMMEPFVTGWLKTTGWWQAIWHKRIVC